MSDEPEPDRIGEGAAAEEVYVPRAQARWSIEERRWFGRRRWVVKLVAANGERVHVSEMYTTRQHAKDHIDAMVRLVPYARRPPG